MAIAPTTPSTMPTAASCNARVTNILSNLPRSVPSGFVTRNRGNPSREPLGAVGS
jgi:hypothetical protein